MRKNRSPQFRTLGWAIATLAALWGPPPTGAAGTSAPPPLQVVCDFEPPVLDRVDSHVRVRVAGCQTTSQAGEPVLPFRTLRLLLPPGVRVEGLQAYPTAATVTLDGSWVVEAGRWPVATPGPRTPSPDPTAVGGLDAAVYQSEALYPSARAELVSVQGWAGYGIALVRVFPLQYVPARGRLVYTPQLRVELTLAADPGAGPAAVRPPARRSMRAGVAELVDNPEALAAHPPDRALRPADTTAAVDYLLITKSNLVAAFQPLLDAKVQAGLAVGVQTVESVTAGFAGRDLAEQVRNCIRDAYTRQGITYVLLGGDTQTVPARNAYVRMGSLVPPNTTIPCDLYYACLDGTWNSNGNTLWGEATDGEGGGDVDLLAEVYVGRAPVDTVAEVTTFVQKSLRQAAPTRPGRTNVLFMAEFLGSFPAGPAQGADMFTPLLPYFSGYQIRWLDDQPATTPQWATTDALQALNSSPSLALFNGHGDVDLMMRMYTADLDRLTNQWPFLAYSVGCNAGEFDNDKFSPDCIGEELVKRHAAGAGAAILNSREGWYDPQQEWKYSGEFQTRFFDHLLTLNRTNIGRANQLGKHDLVGLVETTGTVMTYRWCYYEINLLGDPHLAWQTPAATPDLTDADGDGMAGWQEEVAGTNPADASSVLQLDVRAPGVGRARLEWPSVAGRVYSVWRADDAAGAFLVLTNALAATPPLNVWEDAGAGTGQRFYRVEVRRP